jgi:hypothetical protein
MMANAPVHNLESPIHEIAHWAQNKNNEPFLGAQFTMADVPAGMSPDNFKRLLTETSANEMVAKLLGQQPHPASMLSYGHTYQPGLQAMYAGLQRQGYIPALAPIETLTRNAVVR